MIKRQAFVVSDRTGLTAEAMAHSLLSQFPAIDFSIETRPYVDTEDKAAELVKTINAMYREENYKPLVFVTIVDDDIRRRINSSHAVIFDLFDTFIGPMERELEMESSHSVGQSHGVSDLAQYTARISAVHFALATDDGMDTDHYHRSDIILCGVSRCGKTPTSLYLSLQYGVYASNYPLTEDDLGEKTLPTALQAHKSKVYGLTIDPFRLLQIRQERYSGESYSSSHACELEVAKAESIFRAEGIPVLNTTRMSIEEIGTTIMHKTGLKRAG